MLVHSLDLNTATWRKSTHTQGNGGTCVEVAIAATAVGLRDSKNPEGPVLAVSRPAFASFLRVIKSS